MINQPTEGRVRCEKRSRNIDCLPVLQGPLKLQLLWAITSVGVGFQWCGYFWVPLFIVISNPLLIFIPFRTQIKTRWFTKLDFFSHYFGLSCVSFLGLYEMFIVCPKEFLPNDDKIVQSQQGSNGNLNSQC